MRRGGDRTARRVRSSRLALRWNGEDGVAPSRARPGRNGGAPPVAPGAPPERGLRAPWPGGAPWRAAEADFEAALASVYVAFQPIVAWPGARVFGCEALVRTRHRRLGRARDLLRAASLLGRMRDVGRAVRALAFAAASRLPESVLLFLNLHADDLEDPQLDHAEHAHLRRRVVLELHEEARLEDRADLRRRLRELRRLGYRLALDDMGGGGRGTPSVALLRPDVVKVDASLVRGVERDGARREAVGRIHRVCAENGAALVCEGVESAAERDALWCAGCVLFQGYLFGRPRRRLPALP